MSSKFVFLLLAFALFVAIIHAHYHHHHHRCGCNDDCSPCKCPCKIEKPCQPTSQNPETEVPTIISNPTTTSTSTSTSTSTTPVFGPASTVCKVIFQKPVCRKGVCPQKHLGIWCCCGDDPQIAKPLKNPKSKCYIEYNNTECDAINISCNGCDHNNRCKCMDRRGYLRMTNQA